MKNNDADKQINVKTIEGANFDRNSISDLNGDQKELLALMSQLSKKINEISLYWSKELAK